MPFRRERGAGKGARGKKESGKGEAPKPKRAVKPAAKTKPAAAGSRAKAAGAPEEPAKAARLEAASESSRLAGPARRATGDLIAVDVGNSETVVGLFRGGELATHWRLTSGRATSD